MDPEEELWERPILVGIGVVNPIFFAEAEEDPILYLPNGKPAQLPVEEKDPIGFRLR